MDDMNPSVENTVANSPAVETKVDSGNSSENVVSTRSAIDNAKKRMFGDTKAEVQSKVESQAVESKGEELIVEEHIPDGNNVPTEKKPNDGLLKAREKDKKQISKLTAQKYALKEENARLQAEIEKFKQDMANEPQREDFSDENAYNRAKIRYDMKLENGVERFQEAEKQLEHKRNAEWTDRCEATVKDITQFSENYTKYYNWLMKEEPELMSYAGQSIVGPRMIEEAFNDLFKDREVYARWKGMHPANRKQFLTQVESKLMSEMNGNHQPKQQIAQKSSAPTPIAPEKVSEKVAPKAVSLRDQIARSKAKMFGN